MKEAETSSAKRGKKKLLFGWGGIAWEIGEYEKGEIRDGWESR